MQNVLQLLIRYGSFFTFVFLEIISIYLIVQYNHNQRSIFLNSTKVYNGRMSESVNNYRSYFHLREVNDSLAHQNAELISALVNKPVSKHASDTLSRYIVKPANVVGNTFHLRNNHLTLDIGKSQGAEVGLGVIGKEGLIGIIRNVSKNYAQVNSILHSQTRISCTVAPHLFAGNLVWSNSNPRYMNLEAIPKHIPISKGDTVVTNGFSTIFPKGIMVGTVEDYSVVRGSNNYDIKVRLVNDVTAAQVGYVIIDKDFEEVKKLTETALNGG